MAHLGTIWVLTWQQMIGEPEEVLGTYSSEEKGNAAARSHVGNKKTAMPGEIASPTWPQYYLEEIVIDGVPWKEEQQK